MGKFKWLVCVLVAVCMAFAVAFAGCTVGGKDDTGDTGVITPDPDGEGGGNEGETGGNEGETGGNEGGTSGDEGGSGNEENGSGSGNEDGSGSNTETHTHTLEYTEAKDATETEDGNVEYWYCSGCGKYFSDADATTEITNITIPKLGTAVSISIVTPSSVTASVSSSDYALSNNVLTGYRTGTTLTESGLEALISLTDSNEDTGILGSRQFAGWYVKDVAEDGSVTTTVLDDTTGYTLESATATIAPYYKDINESTDIVVNNYPQSSGVGITTTVDGVKYNGINDGAHPSSWGTHYNVLSNQENTVIVEPSSDDGYAQLGTNVFTNNYSFGGEDDYFRLTTTHSSFTTTNDNVYLYRIQNYGSESIYLTATLVNTSTTAETNLVNVFLAAGASIDLVYSVEYSNFYQGNTANTNTMILLRGTEGHTGALNIGVTTAVITGTSATVAGTTIDRNALATAGYTVGVADVDSTSENELSDSNFVATLTNSTITDAGKIITNFTTSEEGNGGEDNSGSGEDTGNGEDNSGNNEDNTGNGGDEVQTPATISVELPSTVSLSSTSYTSYDSESKTISGFNVGDTLSSSNLPQSSDLTDTNSGENFFASRTFAGWYVREVDETTGAVTTTPITTSYTIASESITIAPYYNRVNGSDALVANGGASSSLQTTIDGTTYNGIATNGHPSSWGSTTHTNVISNTANTVIVEPTTEGGYAELGTEVMTNNYQFGGADDYFRLTTLHSITADNDNIEIYRFQNYGSTTVYFNVVLCNSGVAAETNSVYVYLAPGESAEIVYSVEYTVNHTGSSASNDNTMMVVNGTSAGSNYAFDIGVSVTVIDGTSSTVAGLTVSKTAMESAGYKVGAANYNSTDASDTNFAAYSTNSTIQYDVFSGTITSDTDSSEAEVTALAFVEIEPTGSATQTSSGSKD